MVGEILNVGDEVFHLFEGDYTGKCQKQAACRK